MAGGKVKEYHFNATGGVSSEVYIATPTVSSGGAAWGEITGTVSTQSDVYAQITSRALITTLSSAAFTVSTNYATAAQGNAVSTKAATATLSSSAYMVSTVFAAVATISSAAYTLLTDYATSTQGNAVSSKAAITSLSSSAYMASTVFAAVATLSSAAYTVSSIYATSAQGTKADAAAPATTLSSAAYTLATDYVPASKVSTVKLSTIRFTTTTSSFALTELAFAVSNTCAVNFDFGIVYASAASTTGIRLGLTYPAASSFAAIVNIPTVVATGTDSMTQGNIIASASSVVSPSTPLASTKYFANVYGSICPSANGTLQLIYATEVGGSAISTFCGSYGILTML